MAGSDVTLGFAGLRFAEGVRSAAAAAGAVDVAAVVFEAAAAFFCWLTACVRAMVCHKAWRQQIRMKQSKITI